MPDTWDIAVVGAGFSGSLAAYGLSRKGLRVVVLDRGKQIGQETSGGNLTDNPWWSVFGLKRPEFLVPVARREVAWLGRNFMIAAAKPHPHGELSAFARADLDGYLRDVVRQAGVQVHDDFCVDEITAEPQGPVFLRAGSRAIAAKAVVIASGADEELLARNGFLRRPMHSRAFFVSQQRLTRGAAPPGTPCTLLELQNLPGYRDAVAWVLRMPGDTVVTVRGTVAPESLSDWSFHPVDLIARLKGHPLLEDVFREASVGEWRTRILGGYPPARRRIHGERVLLVGDAARPMGGSCRPGAGFRWAAQTAHEAAEVLAHTLERPTRFRLRVFAERMRLAGSLPLKDRWLFPLRRLLTFLGRLVYKVFFGFHN